MSTISKKSKPLSLKKFYRLQMIAWFSALLFFVLTVLEELNPSLYEPFLIVEVILGIICAVSLCIWLIYNFNHEKIDEMAKEHLNTAHTHSFTLLGALLFLLNCIFSIIDVSETLPTVTLSFDVISKICFCMFALMMTVESGFFLLEERNPEPEEQSE